MFQPLNSFSLPRLPVTFCNLMSARLIHKKKFIALRKLTSSHSGSAGGYLTCQRCGGLIRYKPTNVVITENGVDQPGEFNATFPDVLQDDFRINYFKGYIQAAADAVTQDKVWPFPVISVTARPGQLLSEGSQHARLKMGMQYAETMLSKWCCSAISMWANGILFLEFNPLAVTR